MTLNPCKPHFVWGLAGASGVVAVPVTPPLTATGGTAGKFGVFSVDDSAGLIDWMTLKLERDSAPDWSGWSRLETWADRIIRICPKTGDVRWETVAWDSVRSDSHQIAIKANKYSLSIQGSPARVQGYGDAVFGFGSMGRSLFQCARSMIDFVSKMLHLSPVPSAMLFKLTRVDVTKNYFMPSLAGVRVALSELRSVEGGRYRVSQQAGDTVYWSHLSRMRAGKAYAKGPHLRYLMSKPSNSGLFYTEDDISKADHLLRLELRLGREFWRRLPVAWWGLEWEFLDSQHESFFGRMLGDNGVTGVDMSYVSQIVSAAPSEGQGKSAARTWAMIQTMGWQSTRDSMPLRTWYRHTKILRQAGFGDADISAGRVVSIRKPLVMLPVSSWEHLRQLA